MHNVALGTSSPVAQPAVLESAPSLCGRFWASTLRVFTWLPTSLATIPAAVVGLTQGSSLEGEGINKDTVLAFGWTLIGVIVVRQISDLALMWKMSRIQAIAGRGLGEAPIDSDIQESRAVIPNYDPESIEENPSPAIDQYECPTFTHAISSIAEIVFGLVLVTGLSSGDSMANRAATVIIPLGIVVDLFQLCVRSKEIARLNRAVEVDI